jgi:acyl-CoA reductase-like NAD-dependent aldehyde dehydrogenase
MIDEDAAKRIEAGSPRRRKAAPRRLARAARRQHGAGRLLEKVPHDSDLYRKEAFGPVALLEPFDDFDDALRRVNDSDFGLQAGVFTGRLAHAMRAWDRLEVGGVIVGDVPSFRVDNMPYGGVKLSGSGAKACVTRSRT